MNRLVILDGSSLRWVRRAAARGGSWDLLVLGHDPDSFVARHATLLAPLGTWRILQVGDRSIAAQAEVREYLVRFIHQLPRQQDSRGRRLAAPLEADEGNWWWFLEISEKSPMRGELVNQLYWLALIRSFVIANRYEEIWLSLTSAPLVRCLRESGTGLPPVSNTRPMRAMMPVRPVPPWLRYWLHPVRDLVRWIIVRRILTRVGRQVPRPPDGAVLFFTLFPIWWVDPFGPAARDRFFSALPPEQGRITLKYVAWIVAPAGTLWRERARLAAAIRSHRLVPLQAQVDARAMAGIFSIAAFWKLIRFRRRCGRHLKAHFAGFDVRPLVLHEISRSLGSGEICRDRLIVRAMRRLNATFRPKAVVFRMESQPIDRALIYGTRDSAATVGFWHSAIASTGSYLPFHFAPGELATAGTGGDSLEPPIPDAVLATSSLCKDVLVRQNYPHERVAVCGPIRHRELIRYRRRRPGRADLRRRLAFPLDVPVIFVATSVVPSDTAALLEMLPRLAKAVPDAHFVVKLHPATAPPRDQLARLCRQIGAARLTEASDDALYDYIAAADVMLLGGSVIGFEAMALDVMPIVVENPAAFSAFSLRDFEDACFVASSVEAVAEAIRETLTQSSRAAAKRRRWPSLLRQVFGDLDADPADSLTLALGQLGVLPLPADSRLAGEPR